jgi:hypothetical protein
MDTGTLCVRQVQGLQQLQQEKCAADTNVLQSSQHVKIKRMLNEDSSYQRQKWLSHYITQVTEK